MDVDAPAAGADGGDEGGGGGGEEARVSPDEQPQYHARLFPFVCLWQWLAYGRPDESGEFSFNPPDAGFWRHRAFETVAKLRAAVLRDATLRF